MKAPIVALAATAAGFAAASAYLYAELGVERVSTQAEVAARSKHEARIRQIQSSGQDAQASVLPFSKMQSSAFVEPPASPPKLSLDARPASPSITGSGAPVLPQAAPLGANPTGRGSATASGTFTREDREPAPRLTRRLNREREADAR